MHAVFVLVWRVLHTCGSHTPACTMHAVFVLVWRVLQGNVGPVGGVGGGPAYVTERCHLQSPSQRGAGTVLSVTLRVCCEQSTPDNTHPYVEYGRTM